jgi:hypothetical protein
VLFRSTSEKTEKGEIKKWDIGKLNKNEVLIKKVTANVQNTQLEEVEDIMKNGTK